jgi:hypothetical protein
MPGRTAPTCHITGPNDDDIIVWASGNSLTTTRQPNQRTHTCRPAYQQRQTAAASNCLQGGSEEQRRGEGRPPGHHHEPAPTTTAASNCSRGGWGVLMDRDTRGCETGPTTGTTTWTRRERWEAGATGGMNHGGNERTAGTKATGRGRGWPQHTRNGPK